VVQAEDAVEPYIYLSFQEMISKAGHSYKKSYTSTARCIGAYRKESSPVVSYRKQQNKLNKWVI
jgi:hypothetical protein